MDTADATSQRRPHLLLKPAFKGQNVDWILMIVEKVEKVENV